ncbi:hypothetical protein G2W53_025681 [Senna tora]|uniref:Uncharacterized protein n=1 Tax=Senna tora TaxID=362788 RepID=A0A834TFC5_9FABA|nr:hypothetical protein G2W53_025681 [Senna tora]
MVGVCPTYSVGDSNKFVRDHISRHNSDQQEAQLWLLPSFLDLQTSGANHSNILDIASVHSSAREASKTNDAMVFVYGFSLALREALTFVGPTMLELASLMLNRLAAINGGVRTQVSRIIGFAGIYYLSKSKYMVDPTENLINSSKAFSKPFKLGSLHFSPSLATDLATCDKVSSISAQIKPTMKFSSSEMSFFIPNEFVISSLNLATCLSLKPCHKLTSFDIKLATSNANTPITAFSVLASCFRGVFHRLRNHDSATISYVVKLKKYCAL